MTLLFTDGFDAKDTALKWLIVNNGGSGSISYTGSTRFGAGFAATLPSNAGVGIIYSIFHAFTASSQVFIGAAIQHGRQSGQTYSPPFHLLMADNGTTSHLYLVANNSGSLLLYRGDGRAMNTGSAFTPNGTLLATSAGGVVDGLGTAWHYIEMSATLNASTGNVVVNVDGTQVISFTGNTKNGGTSSNIDTLVYSGMNGGNFGAGINWGSPTIDDLYLCNSSGSSPTNTFLGDARVETCLPTGAGSSTQFTPTGSGNNWQNVNDVPDSLSTYNSDSVAGHRDTYALADVVAGTGTVFAVQQVMCAFKTGAGTASLKCAQQSGATVSYGATRSLGTTAAVYTDVFETNPATSSAWTGTSVNSLEAGAEVV